MFTHLHTESFHTEEHRIDSLPSAIHTVVVQPKAYYGTPHTARISRITTTIRDTWHNGSEKPVRHVAQQVFTRKILKDGTMSTREETLKATSYTEDLTAMLATVAGEIQSGIPEPLTPGGSRPRSGALSPL